MVKLLVDLTSFTFRDFVLVDSSISHFMAGEMNEALLANDKVLPWFLPLHCPTLEINVSTGNECID